MSADNGYVVTYLHNDDERIGIFYYCASVDELPEHFTEDHALIWHGHRMIFTNAGEAIIAAHKIERDSWTEYGVSVNSKVLAA